MKVNFALNSLKYNLFANFGFLQTLSRSSSIFQLRNFSTTESTTAPENQDYYSELVEKSNRLLEKITLSDSELLQNRDVVVYKRNRTCSKCSKTVKVSHPEFVENLCADSWRYFHNFSYVPNCPVHGIMKFTKYGRLRTEQKVLLSTE